MHKKSIVILVLFISILLSGCSKDQDHANINDYRISYLEVLGDVYLVGNDVHINVTDANADEILLNIREYGQEEIEKTIDGEKNGDQWEFIYSNNSYFNKEIWLTYFYEDGQKESEKSIITNQVQSLENAFENIIPIKSEIDYKLTKQNIDLSILGWSSKNRILARDDENVFIFDIVKNEKDILFKDVFNIYPSPSLNLLVYQTSEGIFLGDRKTKDSKKILEIEEGTFFKDLAWSNTESNVLIYLAEKDSNKFYFINLNNNELRDVAIEEYSIEDIIYIDNEYLYALGHIINDNTEIEAPNVLLRIHRRTGNTKNLTPNMQPTDEIKILSQVNNREFLIRITTTTIAEDDISSINTIYLLNTQRGSLKSIQKDIESPYIYSVSPDKNYHIYLKKQDGEDQQGERIVLLGENRKKDIEILKTIQSYPSIFHWSKDGDQIVFYLNNTKEIFLLEKN